MLKQLIVEGFQSHTNSELVFHPGVNVITGLSQSGKTALMRAIGLVVNNRPSGDGFIQRGAKEAFVSLIGEVDGKAFSVSRLKGKKDSYYHVAIGEEDVEFRAFGAGVPERVTELLNMADVNIQDQLSPYFLVLDSPGQIALHIRKVAKLQEIDEIVSMLASKIKVESTEMKSLECQLIDVESMLVPLEKIDLDKLEEAIQSYKSLDKVYKVEVLSVGALIALLENVIKVEEERTTLAKIDIERLDELALKCRTLHVSTIEERAQVDVLDSIVCSLQEMEVIDLPDDVDGLLECGRGLRERQNRGEVEIEVLHANLRALSDLEASYSVLLGELDEAEKERNVIVGELKECPYCGQELKGDAVRYLVSGVCNA
ncbi:MAG: AAA family ATPase [Candidatus Thorarchaeota archaeon]